MPSVPEAISNPPRDAFDLYTPRFVKGKGTSKVRLCCTDIQTILDHTDHRPGCVQFVPSLFLAAVRARRSGSP